MLATASKPLLRTEMKTRRAALAQAQPLAANHLAHQATRALDEKRLWPAKGALIAGYWPIQSEISPFHLMQDFEDRGYLLALPCLVPFAPPTASLHFERNSLSLTSLPVNGAGDFMMIFRRFHIGDALEDGPFDIRQPLTGAETVQPDVLLVPLLGFDGHGHRLGYGSGHFDRALGALRARKTVTAYGVAFSGQQLAEIPCEAHDQLLDGIFTESGLVVAKP